MAPVELKPTIQLNPWQKYQQALQAYQAQNPQLAGQYEAMGAPSGMGQPGLPTSPGNNVIPSLLIGKAIAGQAAAPAVTSGLAQTAAANAAWNAPAMAATQGTAAPLTAAGGIGALPMAGIGLAGILAGKAGYDMFKGKKPNLPGRVVLGMATGGLSEVAKAAGLFGHKSTGERQNERWQQLAEAGSAPEWAFANGVNQDQGFGDRDLKAGIDPRKVWASSAMFDTFGKDWATTGTELQREEITKQILANNLIDTKQGVSYMLDKDKANSIKAGVLASMLTTPAKPVNNPNSPGFKDGKRINYGSKSR